METIIICNQCNKPKTGTQTGICYRCGKFGKTNKELSLEWWNSLSSDIKTNITYEYYNSTMWRIVSNDNILEMYKGEILQPGITISRPNIKQFKEFNTELFTAYINKFSDEDKLKALKTIAEGLNRTQISFMIGMLSEIRDEKY